MSTPVIPDEVASFARSVRAELADLTDDEVEELTGGLEADLSEAYADDLRRELPDPGEYAAELRAAAGLPPREHASESAGWFAGLSEDLRRMRRDTASRLRQQPVLAEAMDVLVVLRPVWWVLRAVVAVTLIGLVLGFGLLDGPWAILAVLATIVSVQWGRGSWGGRRLRGVIVVGNVLAAVLLAPVVVASLQNVRYAAQDDYVDDTYVAPTGVTSQGRPVTNVFAYGADGKPLRNVQLFDQDGRPLDTSAEECDGCVADDPDRLADTSRLETGQEVRNVFPLQFLSRVFDDERGDYRVSDVPQRAKAPFVKVPSVEPTPTGATRD